MDKRKQLKKIAKKTIHIGDAMTKEFDKHKSVLKARTAVNAYRTAIAAIIVLERQ